jgi:CheY-like chemotaxis protein
MLARVLVVDDNVDMVETMTTLLQLEGCEAKGCLFATEALHYVCDFQPEVVLLDIRMPGKSGFDVDEIRGPSRESGRCSSASPVNGWTEMN